MQDDVWTGTDTAAAPPGEATGDGMPVNQAFSFDRVLRYGAAFAKEQTLFSFVAGFVLLLCQFGPVIAAIPFSLMAAAVGENDGGTVAQLGANIVQMGLSLVAAPVQALVTAGIARAVLGYARGEAVEWSALYTQVMPALRGFVYQLVVGVVTAFLAVMFVIPGVLAIVLPIAGASEWDLGPLAWVIAAVGGLILLLGFAVLVYVALGLALGYSAAGLDGLWPHEAIAVSWKAAKGSRLTLLMTYAVVGVTVTISVATVYCLIGLVLFPIVQVAWQAGMAMAWLLHSRDEAITRSWPFFERQSGV